MFEHPATLIVIVIVAAVGVGIGVYSWRRRRRVRRLCSEAGQAIEQGHLEDARRLLLAAERGWAFNSHDGSRRSRLADLDDFAAIVSLFARLPGHDASCVPRVQAVIGELHALFADRGSFGIDGRSMKRDAATRWTELSERFQTLRHELRESYDSPKAAA